MSCAIFITTISCRGAKSFDDCSMCPGAVFCLCPSLLNYSLSWFWPTHRRVHFIPPLQKKICVKVRTTDTQWSLFQWNPKILGLGREIGQINSGAFGVFSAKPILVQWVPCPCFPLFIHYFLIYPKYSKHWLSTLAHTIDCVCSKILNHGLNHGLLFSLFMFFGWKNIHINLKIQD
jgi:hypothetical protein